MTLTEFLLARIAEDEVNIGYGDVRTQRECDAKRRIVEEYRVAEQAAVTYVRIDWQANPARGERERATSQARWHALGDAVFTLAAIYADHPDYDPSWRP